MKKIVIGLLVTTLTISTAYADTYVKVDANGNAISGPIACSADTCGGTNSLYEQLTLGTGERYVLQSVTGGGIGNNTPNKQVTVDNNVWTVTSTDYVKNEITTQRYDTVLENPIGDTSVVPIDTATVTIDSATVTSSTPSTDVYSLIMALLNKVFALMALLK